MQGNTPEQMILHRLSGTLPDSMGLLENTTGFLLSGLALSGTLPKLKYKINRLNVSKTFEFVPLYDALKTLSLARVRLFCCSKLCMQTGAVL